MAIWLILGVVLSVLGAACWTVWAWRMAQEEERKRAYRRSVQAVLDKKRSSPP